MRQTEHLVDLDKMKRGRIREAIALRSASTNKSMEAHNGIQAPD